MATPTYTPIASITLSSSASSVEFSSIPQDYRDLVIVFSGGVTSGIDDLKIRLNNDSSSSYSYVVMEGNGSSASSFTGSSDAFVTTAGSNIGTGQSSIIVQLMDYSATDKHTTALSRHNNVDAEVNALAGRYSKTDAITEISLSTPADQFFAGSTFALYGIAS